MYLPDVPCRSVAAAAAWPHRFNFYGVLLPAAEAVAAWAGYVHTLPMPGPAQAGPSGSAAQEAPAQPARAAGSHAPAPAQPDVTDLPCRTQLCALVGACVQRLAATEGVVKAPVDGSRLGLESFGAAVCVAGKEAARLMRLIPLAPDSLPSLMASLLCLTSWPVKQGDTMHGLLDAEGTGSASFLGRGGVARWGPLLVQVCLSCGLGPSTAKALKGLLLWVIKNPTGALDITPHIHVGYMGRPGPKARAAAEAAEKAERVKWAAIASPTQGLADVLELMSFLQAELSKRRRGIHGGGGGGSGGSVGFEQGPAASHAAPKAQMWGQLCTSVADAVQCWRDEEIHTAALTLERAKQPREAADEQRGQQREQAERNAWAAVDRAHAQLVVRLFQVLPAAMWKEAGQAQLERIITYFCTSMRTHSFDVFRVLGPATLKVASQGGAEAGGPAFATLLTTCTQVGLQGAGYEVFPAWLRWSLQLCCIKFKGPLTRPLVLLSWPRCYVQGGALTTGSPL